MKYVHVISHVKLKEVQLQDGERLIEGLYPVMWSEHDREVHGAPTTAVVISESSDKAKHGARSMTLFADAAGKEPKDVAGWLKDTLSLVSCEQPKKEAVKKEVAKEPTPPEPAKKQPVAPPPPKPAKATAEPKPPA